MDLAEPGPAALIGLIVVGVLGVLALAITAWVFWPSFRGPAAARAALGTHRLALGSLVALLVLISLMSLPFVPFLRQAQGLNTIGFAVAFLSTDLPMLLLVYVRLVRPGAVTWRELGLRPLPIDYVLRMGLGAGLVGFVATTLVSALLSQVGMEPNQIEQFSFVLTEGPLSFLLVLFFGAIMAPFVEEIFFRGFLFGMYKRRQPLWVAYLGSCVPFTLLHVQPNRMNLSQMAGLSVGILVLAVILTWVYDRTGSLFPGMLAHAVNNATGLILYYFAGVR